MPDMFNQQQGDSCRVKLDKCLLAIRLRGRNVTRAQRAREGEQGHITQTTVKIFDFVNDGEEKLLGRFLEQEWHLCIELLWSLCEEGATGEQGMNQADSSGSHHHCPGEDEGGLL